MLDALKPFSRSEAERVLASAVLAIDTDPVTGRLVLPRDAPVVHRQILDEAYFQLGIDPQRIDRRDRSRVFNFLSGKLTETIKPGSSPSEIRDRLGQKGLLATSSYDIAASESLDQGLAGDAMTRDTVFSTIRNAQAFQHMLTKQVSATTDQAFSLFIGSFGTASDGERYAILVLAERRRRKLTAMFAVYVFPSDLDLAGAQSLLCVLEALTERYGIGMRVNGIEQKFFYSEEGRRFDRPADVPIFSKPATAEGVWIGTRGTDGPETLHCLFFIDRTGYVADLNRHGIGAVVVKNGMSGSIGSDEFFRNGRSAP